MTLFPIFNSGRWYARAQGNHICDYLGPKIATYVGNSIITYVCIPQVIRFPCRLFIEPLLNFQIQYPMDKVKLFIVPLER